MNTAAKEHTRRTVQLRYNNTLSTVDNECTIVGHVGNGTQEYILNNRIKVLMIGVGTEKFQLCLQRHAVCQTSLQALLN